MPEAGLEPARLKKTSDFKSEVSAIPPLGHKREIRLCPKCTSTGRILSAIPNQRP